MRFRVAVTDNSWFNFLSNLSPLPDEVNFWQPSGTSFRAIDPGELFLFKLHSPLNYIVGGGFFVRHSVLPLSLAWEAFEQKNGTKDFESFHARIIHFRKQYKSFEPDPMIGCIILTEPFFFIKKEEWIPIPENWSPNIVQGKTYNTDDSVGKSLWSKIQECLSKNKEKDIELIKAQEVAEEGAAYGAEYLMRARLGQGAFRILVTEAYKRKCAITGERTLPVLESAHIKPYSKSGPHRVNNGLLLRSDLHKLFDLGYVTITTDFHIEVSKRIKEEYENGRAYYALHGQELNNLPVKPSDWPTKGYIEWHNKEIFMP